MFLAQLLACERYPVVALRDDEVAAPAFLEELFLRGYDLATLRLSVFMKGHGDPKKARLMSQSRGVLACKWARVPHDGPDLCTAWGTPATRRDANMLMSLFSRPAHFSILSAKVACRRGDWKSAREVLTQLGWDERTLKLSVRHLGWLYRPDFAGQAEHP